MTAGKLRVASRAPPGPFTCTATVAAPGQPPPAPTEIAGHPSDRDRGPLRGGDGPDPFLPPLPMDDGRDRLVAVRPDLVVPSPHREERVVVPIPGLNRSVVQAVNVARSIGDDVRAVFITEDPVRAEAMREQWERQGPHVPLVVVESPYRALVGPLTAYLDVLDRAWPPDKEAPITFVVVPEYVARNWWERILYNQSARQLRTALLGRSHTVVVGVPYRREDERPEDRHEHDGPPDATRPGPAATALGRLPPGARSLGILARPQKPFARPPALPTARRPVVAPAPGPMTPTVLVN